MMPLTVGKDSSPNLEDQITTVGPNETRWLSFTYT
jgi:hypothetical protein